MDTSRKSIFDLERRTDLFTDHEMIINDLERTQITSDVFSKMSIMNLLNASIRVWPYRQAATNIRSYASSHGFVFFEPETEQDVLYSYELLLNLLHWAPVYEKEQQALVDEFGLDGYTTIPSECDRCLDNLKYCIEMLNMGVRKKEMESTPQYSIFKRDAQVDAVIEAVPELSEVLLSYLDVRNQNDIGAKRAVLRSIADYLEKRHLSNYYKGSIYSSLEDNLFSVFNNAYIRHDDGKQWNLHESEWISLYDQTFKAAIHLMQMEDIKEFNKRVKELKQAGS